MKKLSIILGLVFILGLLATPALPLSFKFDIEADGDFDDSYTFSGIGDTVQVDVYLDGNTCCINYTSYRLYYGGDYISIPYDDDPTDEDDVWANDDNHGGPWESSNTVIVPYPDHYRLVVGLEDPVNCESAPIKLNSFIVHCEKGGGSSQIYTNNTSGGVICVGSPFTHPDDTTATLYGPCVISIDPEYKSVKSGETIQFSAAEDGGCNDPSYNWSVSDGCGSNIDANGLYTAGDVAPCTDTVTVTDTENGNIKATATVDVVPLCELNIWPQSKTLLSGETLRFQPIEECKDPCYSWEIMEQGSTGSTINNSGEYTAGGIGKDKIKATDECNAVSDTATVEVVPCKISLIPTLKSVFPDDTVHFSASVDGQCNTPCYDWDVISSSGGSIDASGLYTAGSAFGIEMVTVTDTCNNNIADDAVVKVVPCKVTIDPPSESVYTWETLQFAATVNAYGEATCNEPCFTWNVMSGGGTIDASGLYTPGSTIGTEVITVTDTCNEYVSDTVVVNVIHEDTTTTTTIPRQCTSFRDCDDGVFCNGVEKCVLGKCKPGKGNPCEPDLLCDEDNDVCVECLSDEDCDNEVFCDGEETCKDGVCQDGTPPNCDDGKFCTGVENCDEEVDACVSSGDPCPEGTECIEETNECVPKPAEINITLIPKSALRSHLIPLPLFMFIVGEESHFNQKTVVSFDGDAIVPPVRLVLSSKLIFVVSLIKPASLGTTGSTEVSVTVTSTVVGGEEPYDEVGSENLSLNTLPWIFDEQEEKLTTSNY